MSNFQSQTRKKVHKFVIPHLLNLTFARSFITIDSTMQKKLVEGLMSCVYANPLRYINTY